jgi:hypothetical protein
VLLSVFKTNKSRWTHLSAEMSKCFMGVASCQIVNNGGRTAEPNMEGTEWLCCHVVGQNTSSP